MFQVNVTVGATPELLQAINRIADVLSKPVVEAESKTKVRKTVKPLVETEEEAPQQEAEAPQAAEEAPQQEPAATTQDPAPKYETDLSLATVREKVIALSRAGKKDEVRKLLVEYDAAGVNEVNDLGKLAEFYNDLKTIK